MQHLISRKWILVVAVLTLMLPCQSQAEGTPQDVMRSCVSDAGERKGEERKAFMLGCLTDRRPTLDQTGKPPKAPCEGVSADDAMRCSAPTWQAAEAELNTNYQSLRRKLKDSGLQHLEPQLVRAQRDWVKYRQSHCGFDAAIQVEGNSWTSYYLGACMASEASSRAQHLLNLLP